MKFRVDIEGLRAVAIISVVLYHMRIGFAYGGFVGVDVFFVISGYLITKIIANHLESDNFRLIDFYKRRIARLFPALFVMLAIVTILAVFVLPPTRLQAYASTLSSAALFVSNIRLWQQSSYFEYITDSRLLLHTWSLSIEEQFYIVLPLVLIAIHRWGKSRYGFYLAVLALLSFWLNIRFMAKDETLAFFMGPPRAFELLIGALLATRFAGPTLPRSLREVIGLSGAAAILFAICTFDDDVAFPGFYALIPCLGTAAVIYAGTAGPTVVSSVLSWRPLRFIGAISYSLYLWHWPLLGLLRTYYFGIPPYGAVALTVALSFGLAVLSWKYVERPFLVGNGAPRRIFAKAAFASLCAVIVGVYGVRAAGLPWRYSPEALKMFATNKNFSPTRQSCFRTRLHPLTYDQSCIYGEGSDLGKIAVWGDSHAAELAYQLGQIAGDRARFVELSFANCPPALNYHLPLRPECAIHNQNILSGVLKDKNVKYVVLTAWYLRHAQRENFWHGLDAMVATLEAAGKQVVMVYPYPTFPASIPETLANKLQRGAPLVSSGMTREQFRQESAGELSHLNAIVSRHHVLVGHSEDVICPNGFCSVFTGEQVLYLDNSHLSLAGAKLIAAKVIALVEGKPPIQNVLSPHR